MSPKFVTGGIMLRGRRTPAEILEELERQKASVKDYVLSTSDVSFMTHPVTGDLTFVLDIDDGDFPERLCMPLNSRTHAQIAQYVGLPMRSGLYKRFRTGSSTNEHLYYETWAMLYNEVLHKEPSRRLFRTVEDSGGNRYLRAFLSNRYMIIDNADVFFAAADALENVGAEIVHARLDDDHFHIYAVAPGICAQVSPDRVFTDADGKRVRWSGDKADVLNAAISISNSETGEGQCEIRPAIFRSVSQTYSVWDSVLSKRHAGGTDAADAAMLTDDTRRKKNDVFYSEIKDWVAGTFTPETLEKYIKIVEGAAVDEVVDPIAAVEGLRVTYDITDDRKDAIRDRFLRQGDRSRYGLAQAIMDESAGDLAPSEGTNLERISAKVLEITTSEELAHVGRREIKSRESKVPATAVAVGDLDI